MVVFVPTSVRSSGRTGRPINYKDGSFATNRLFCPSYNENGVDSTVGCWAAYNSKTSSGWVSNSDPDYNYACLIMNISGTVHNNSMGNVIGWAGRAWNWSSCQMEFRFGYPSETPLPGGHIIAVAAPEAYEYHFPSGGQASKFTGSDLTKGSTGGSWILCLRHRDAEYPDTDGTNITDPGSLWVNGVNSHWRCRIDCRYPPTTTNGRYWQEMNSPPFRNTSASDKSEDIFSCLL